jgi:hypothetical protein
MTKEQLKQEIYKKMEDKPSFIRNGQFVFNYIDYNYGVARAVQFDDGIDCFYRDECIDEFIECSVRRINAMVR